MGWGVIKRDGVGRGWMRWDGMIWGGMGRMGREREMKEGEGGGEVQGVVGWVRGIR